MERYPKTPAQHRITENLGDPYDTEEADGAPMTPAQAIDTVVLAHHAHLRPDVLPHHRMADEQDVKDALTLLTPAREVLEYQEMQLIDMARYRGWTWERIGSALSIGDRRQAQQRYRRLRERSPDYVPMHVEYGETPDIDGAAISYETLDVGACADPQKALETAAFLLWPVSSEANGEYWETLARTLLTGYLMAAALDHGSLDTVRTWFSQPEAPRPMEVLRSGPKPGLADQCEQILDAQYASVSTLILSALQHAASQREIS